MHTRNWANSCWKQAPFPNAEIQTVMPKDIHLSPLSSPPLLRQFLLHFCLWYFRRSSSLRELRYRIAQSLSPKDNQLTTSNGTNCIQISWPTGTKRKTTIRPGDMPALSDCLWKPYRFLGTRTRKKQKFIYRQNGTGTQNDPLVGWASVNRLYHCSNAPWLCPIDILAMSAPGEWR